MVRSWAVCICGLVGEMILASWFAGAFHVAGFRVCAADPFITAPFVPFDLLHLPLLPLPGLALQLGQPFLLIGVQPLQ